MTEATIQQLHSLTVYFTTIDFRLTKVWYDEKTNAIRARFKNDMLGMVSGIVKPHFVLRETMELPDIVEAITVDAIRITEVGESLIMDLDI